MQSSADDTRDVETLRTACVWRCGVACGGLVRLLAVRTYGLRMAETARLLRESFGVAMAGPSHS